MGVDDLLQELSVESLPERILHRTHLSLFEANKDRGLVPASQLSKGKGCRGREGRQHVHFLSPQQTVINKEPLEFDIIPLCLLR